MGTAERLSPGIWRNLRLPDVEAGLRNIGAAGAASGAMCKAGDAE